VPQALQHPEKNRGICGQLNGRSNSVLESPNCTLGDDLTLSLKQGDRLKVAASRFSIDAVEALKSELGKIESLGFIVTVRTFFPTEAADEFVRTERSRVRR
jgi:hypothetical protein